MKRLWQGFCIAFSLYSAIPVPQQKWEEKNMQYALCFFPLVGVTNAICIFGWWRLCLIYELMPALFAGVAIILPLCISGGIHMDGWVDTVDAVSSHADIARKLEILKDPHVGAFGVMGCAGLLLLQFALWQQLYYNNTPFFFLLALSGFIASRCLNALSIAIFPCAKETGLARIFSDSAAKKAVVICNIVFLVILFACLSTYSLNWAAIAVGASFGYFIFHWQFCMKRFGGNTGDLAGFLLQAEELICLLVAVIGGMVL